MGAARLRRYSSRRSIKPKSKEPLSADAWRKEIEKRLKSLSLAKRMEFKALERQFEGKGQWGLPAIVKMGRQILRRWKR